MPTERPRPDTRVSRRSPVSGGTTGIGLACAERLVASGDRVWVLGSSDRTY